MKDHLEFMAGPADGFEIHFSFLDEDEEEPIFVHCEHSGRTHRYYRGREPDDLLTLACGGWESCSHAIEYDGISQYGTRTDATVILRIGPNSICW